jgi:hypothetical protein
MGWNEDLTWEEWQDLRTREDAVAAAEAAATTAEEAAAAAEAAAALAAEMEAAMTESVDAAGPQRPRRPDNRLADEPASVSPIGRKRTRWPRHERAQARGHFHLIRDRETDARLLDT